LLGYCWHWVGFTSLQRGDIMPDDNLAGKVVGGMVALMGLGVAGYAVYKLVTPPSIGEAADLTSQIWEKGG